MTIIFHYFHHVVFKKQYRFLPNLVISSASGRVKRSIHFPCLWLQLPAVFLRKGLSNYFISFDEIDIDATPTLPLSQRVDLCVEAA